MKLKVLYDRRCQRIELSMEDVDRLCASFSIEEYENLPQQEKEKKLQEAFNKQFNKAEANNFKQQHRYLDGSESFYDEDGVDPLMPKTFFKDVFIASEKEILREDNYERFCLTVQKLMPKKPHWYKAFIAVKLDGMKIKDYAASIGVGDPSLVSRWVTHAEEKIKRNFKEFEKFF